MKLLIDTHVFLWAVHGDPRLSKPAREAYLNRRNDLYVSAASFWEIGIKVSLGKLELASGWLETLRHEMEASGLRLLPVEPEHCASLASLPFHHRDPFDRLLVTQALKEGMSIITADRKLAEYEPACVW
ncbi:MAG: PIN domain nuclease [Gemmatimonadaceae bacterium]|jgi:PIN domain nuclease of toxin-antitoxin system|nr:PIN domain nuclease [Gemmatimonadaceae bacterium]|tara:strand:+ start:265 stop:651 length:387 start_codon:yes stop_codon:yes gene_type:complete